MVHNMTIFNKHWMNHVVMGLFDNFYNYIVKLFQEKLK